MYICKDLKNVGQGIPYIIAIKVSLSLLFQEDHSTFIMHSLDCGQVGILSIYQIGIV